MALQLHNTLTQRKEEFVPARPGEVRMYHCGPTVYSSPHIGNFRTFLLADLLRRFLEDRGYRVHQVMNVTDVGHLTNDADEGEDRMEIAARREKLDPWKIARKYEDEFRECLAKLHFRVPHEIPRATEHIAEMGAIIQDLLRKGHAYQVPSGNVYFAIESFPGYGKLSKKVIEDLEEGYRVEVKGEKRNPKDFALWKVDPKHIMQWDAPFAGGVRGFPGWHIECSAMSMKYLGPNLDVHTGGEDNLFPHHECEVAQSEAHTGRPPFARYWLHVKHLLVDGKKMAKSQGNFVTVQQVLDKGYSGVELRYALMRVHYRQTSNFTWAGLDEARTALNRVRESRGRVARIATGREPAGPDDLAPEIARADAAFTTALEDDLNTSEALAAVFEFVRVLNKARPSVAGADAARRAFARFEDVLGCLGSEPPPSEVLGRAALQGGAGLEAGASAVPAEVQTLLAQRQAARKAKDFAEADRLRDELARRGWKIVDTPQGPRLAPA